MINAYETPNVKVPGRHSFIEELSTLFGTDEQLFSYLIGSAYRNMYIIETSSKKDIAKNLDYARWYLEYARCILKETNLIPEELVELYSSIRANYEEERNNFEHGIG